MDKQLSKVELEHLREQDANYVVQQINQYIVIRLGNEQYGISINYIDNIVRMQHITRVPKVANYIRGVINLRGEVIPVMSLRLKMGLPEDVETKSTRIIILKIEEHGNIGVIVDEVKQVVNLDENQVERPTYDKSSEKENFISGVGKSDGNLISLLDLNAVTLERE